MDTAVNIQNGQTHTVEDALHQINPPVSTLQNPEGGVL